MSQRFDLGKILPTGSTGSHTEKSHLEPVCISWRLGDLGLVEQNTGYKLRKERMPRVRISTEKSCGEGCLFPLTELSIEGLSNQTAWQRGFHNTPTVHGSPSG